MSNRIPIQHWFFSNSKIGHDYLRFFIECLLKLTFKTYFFNPIHAKRGGGASIVGFYLQLFYRILYIVTIFRSGAPLWLSFSVRPTVCPNLHGRTMHIVEKLIKITLPNFICKFIGQFPTYFILWTLTSAIKFDLWGQNKNFKIQ